MVVPVLLQSVNQITKFESERAFIFAIRELELLFLISFRNVFRASYGRRMIRVVDRIEGLVRKLFMYEIEKIWVLTCEANQKLFLYEMKVFEVLIVEDGGKSKTLHINWQIIWLGITTQWICCTICGIAKLSFLLFTLLDNNFSVLTGIRCYNKQTNKTLFQHRSHINNRDIIIRKT